MPKYQVIGPEGIPSRPDYLDSLPEAFDELASFLKRFVKQGYYSGCGFQIPVEILHCECGIKTISDAELAHDAAEEAAEDEAAEAEIRRIEGSQP